MRIRVGAIGAISLALVFTACSGGDDDGLAIDTSDTADTDTGESDDASDDAETPTADNGDNGNDNDNDNGNGDNDNDNDNDDNDNDDDGFDYVPWGPDDPPVPGRYLFLHTASPGDLDCDAVEGEAPPDNDFWKLALDVCRAIAGDGAWPTGGSLPPLPPAENGFQGCMDDELASMLEAAISWRAAHPDREPEISFPSATQESPCRSRVFGVETVPNDEGVLVLLATADEEPADMTVAVDGVQVVVDRDLHPDPFGLGSGLTGAGFFLDGPVEAHTATLEVTNRYGSSTSSIDLPSSGTTADGETIPEATSPDPTSPDTTSVTPDTDTEDVDTGSTVAEPES